MEHRAIRFTSGLLLLATWTAVGACGGNGGPAGVESRFPLAESHGIDGQALEAAYARATEIPRIQSLLVQRNGVLVAEEYFHGFLPDSLHDVRSVTKSVMSILTGIAVDRGHIEGIDQTLGELLPGITDTLPEEKRRISVRHLLMMSSGLDWHELDGGTSYVDWWRSDDMLEFILALPIVHDPGERFLYNTGASHLLSVILTEVSGQATWSFARDNLLSPLGVSRANWLRLPDGYYAGGMGLKIDALTMLRIGQLVLDGGIYNGDRVVSESWIAQATSPHLSLGNVATPLLGDYGYLWWLGESGGANYVLANGYGGQFILIERDLDLVVVASSGWQGLSAVESGQQWNAVLDLVVSDVLGAVRD